jgi:16S rRNA (cytosine967-C5)-methyltransferase
VVGYATCSPHPGEAREQIEQLVARRTDVEVLDARPMFDGVPALDDSPLVQLWPHRHGTDAMFFAAIRRF